MRRDELQEPHGALDTEDVPYEKHHVESAPDIDGDAFAYEADEPEPLAMDVEPGHETAPG